MAEKPIVRHYQSGASSLIAWFCDEMGLVEHINRSVDWNESHWKVSPGQHVMALIINTLCGRDPLCHVQHFYDTQDTEVLFGEGVTAQDFNDDALGRTLDRLYEAGPKRILTSLTLRHLLQSDKPLWFAHADTTSKSFHGLYEPKPGEPEAPFQLRRGYSKDREPDLKQMIIGMLTVHGGMPLFADVRSGNLSDKTWNTDMVETIAQELTPEQIQKLVYTADSAFFTRENVELAHRQNLKFITLVSDNHLLRQEAIEEVCAQPAMEEIGTVSSEAKASTYRVQAIHRSFHGIDLRLVVVHSSQLFEQKRATYHKRLAAEREQLEKEKAEMEKREFACTHDAEEAWQKWQHKHRKSHHPLAVHVEASTRPMRRSGRGRPKKDETPLTETVYTLKIDILPVPTSVMEEAEFRMGYFVLATNIMDETVLPAANVLREYKEQSTVEMRFKFLKDPQFVDALFLKTPSRIEALGYVLLMALFLYMTFEKRLRLALANKKMRLQPVPGRYTDRPTARVVLQLLSVFVTTLCWYDKEDGKWHRDLAREHDQVNLVFELLHFDRSYYTTIRSKR
jgi:transposase